MTRNELLDWRDIWESKISGNMEALTDAIVYHSDNICHRHAPYLTVEAWTKNVVFKATAEEAKQNLERIKKRLGL